ncbi:hypothetical protein C483_14260 [Natrialba hulunbeirensis JCM 10989]|uniref:Glycogen debranching enzyme C-terminal domain-containing protein n=1 Tax=Natrialba hulunbeirensis JCM 10989 TaxID=1227493 RepID=L9ZSQ5_9EURY|nr:hypothetical protein [Natrialba hulunbeirensis]ELY89121.1 hypothetical protein C483_14260 [Natrialba hulunbeirensis JCM 10989]
MGPLSATRYYSRELSRRLAHYARVRRHGYPDHGSLEQAAETILAERAAGGIESGGHFHGVWPRDLCFAARGLVTAGYQETVATTGDWLVSQLSNVFYTDFHTDASVNAATPAEGVDTFPALVLLLAEADRLEYHAESIATLAALHDRKFVDSNRGLVTGAGSSWWDSAAAPREAYNTALLLAAARVLESREIPTVFTGRSAALREGLGRLWNGSYFDERRGSSVLACDANVPVLYFGLVEPSVAETIVNSLGVLETPNGLRLRGASFSPREVHPFFLLHRDYHTQIWPWNSFAYAVGLRRYGFDARARREVERVERCLAPVGTFLELYRVTGKPYVKRGYAAVGDFMVAAALWRELQSL